MTSNKPFVETLFFEEPAGRFALGQILTSTALHTDFERWAGRGDAGTWRCDLRNHDALTWSDKVYEIFGLPHGSAVVREDAVAKYLDHSRGVLERVRTYAINRKCGFILDAAINPSDATIWIRILAAPVLEDGRVIGLCGLKRVLKV